MADTWIAAAAHVPNDYVVTTKRDFTRLHVDAWHYEKEAPPGRADAGHGARRPAGSGWPA